MEVYLDNSATTKPIKEAVDMAVTAMEEYYGNPSSLHKLGIKVEQLLKYGKEIIAKSLGCNDDEIFFTSGATESNNTAILGTASATVRRGKTIVTTTIEHPSVMDTVKLLEEKGYKIKRLMPEGKDGTYTPMQFFNAVDDDTVLVSVMMVNNETGLVQPVKEIAKAVKQKNSNTVFHTDAVQGYMKMPIKLKNTDIDLLSASGHKIGAPKGIGILYKKKSCRILPIIHGGGQQNNLRSGTEPVPMIAALTAAVKVGTEKLTDNQKHYAELKKHLTDRLEAVDGVKINSTSNCADHIVNISVYGIRSEIMLHFLESKEIYVSSGSACSKGGHSYVLDALGIDRLSADEALRISFCPNTTTQMLDSFIDALKDGIANLAKQRK